MGVWGGYVGWSLRGGCGEDHNIREASGCARKTFQRQERHVLCPLHKFSTSSSHESTSSLSKDSYMSLGVSFRPPSPSVVAHTLSLHRRPREYVLPLCVRPRTTLHRLLFFFRWWYLF